MKIFLMILLISAVNFLLFTYRDIGRYNDSKLVFGSSKWWYSVLIAILIWIVAHFYFVIAWNHWKV